MKLINTCNRIGMAPGYIWMKLEYTKSPLCAQNQERCQQHSLWRASPGCERTNQNLKMGCPVHRFSRWTALQIKTYPRGTGSFQRGLTRRPRWPLKRGYEGAAGADACEPCGKGSGKSEHNNIPEHAGMLSNQDTMHIDSDWEQFSVLFSCFDQLSLKWNMTRWGVTPIAFSSHQRGGETRTVWEDSNMERF